MLHAGTNLQVIQTLSGCYTGEFPHLPVPGTGKTYSLQGGRKDLISLKDLRLQACPHVTLAPPHSSNDQDSPVRVVPSPPLPTDPPAHQSKGLLHSPTRSLLRTSSESLVSSAEGEAEVCWRTGGDASGHLTQAEVEAGGEVTDELNSQSEERQREKTKELHNSGESEEENTDREEESTTKQDVGAWCGCRAYGEGLQRGTVHDANAFIIDTSEAESGEIRVSVEGPREGTVSATEVYQAEGHNDGVYQVFFWVTCPATYYISITWAGQHLAGSPFTCEPRTDISCQISVMSEGVVSAMHPAERRHRTASIDKSKRE
ncbi:hypothetical protein O3P69_009859 [Scylla paramamosain]|uniref:Uncharacterized protein n=1 Tax=Scylla paramamosain TaxID=85552 RepID=A0AAW0SM67_SCYPA